MWQRLRLLSTGLLALAAGLGCPGAPDGGTDEDFVRATNRGKAHLENKESADAVTAFTAAVELVPRSAPAWRNLARARMLARDDEAALEALGRAAEIEPDSAATSYLRGLAEAHLARLEDAVTHFEDAVRLDPDTAALRFQLASVYQTLERRDPAIDQLNATVDLDPLHIAAHYKLASYARLAGDGDELERHQREWRRLREVLGDASRTPELLERCVYTGAETPAAAAPEPAPLAVSFVDATAELLGDPPPASTAVVLEVGADGLPTVLAVAADGRVASLIGGADSGLAFDPPEDGFLGATAAVGNFHDPVPEGVTYRPEVHARQDLLLLGPDGARLLLQEETGRLVDVTAEAGLGRLGGRRARWADADHDGDLDLLVAGDQRSRESGLGIWQNAGNGTFREATEEMGIGDTGAAVDVAAVDLDGDVAIDLVVARGELPTLVLENQRTGSFAPREDPPGPWPAADRVLADDLDNDGNPDVVLLGAREAVLIYGGQARRERLDLQGFDAGPAVLVDVDNDGLLDLCVGGAPGLRLWRNEGAAWREVTAETGLAAHNAAVRDLVAADLDGDGDSDLLLVTAAGLRALRNDGGDLGGQLKVRLVGTKTNPGGVGTRVEVRSAEFLAVRHVSGPPIEIGLGGHQKLDSVLTVWTNGVVDNQIDLAAGDTPLTIVEKNVATGSCPFLYAWDGEGFAFVTDILGNSPLGLSLHRGVPLAADPDELVEIGGPDALAVRDGAWVVQVTEEMREVLYLDEARLVAVDHDPGVEVHPTDKLAPPPFPASEVWALGASHELRRAESGGVDLTGVLRAVDGRFAPPGEPLPPPLRGVTRPRSLVLDFGPVDVSRPLVLALTGWLLYGDASTNIAVSQNPDAVALPPSLQVQTGGSWRPVDVTVGMPAGKTKTLLVDLAGKLPPGSRRLRLTTSLEIRWDRAALFERLPASAAERRDLAASSAVLRWRGFSDIRSRAPGHPTTPAWAEVSERPPWRTALRGWHTRYGDVLPLVAARDERLVVMGAGDALELAFDAGALPPPAAGRQRTFFFYSTGWDKDGDHNVIDGDTVEPLPVVAAGDDWRVRYNTRWVSEHRFR